MSNLLPFPNDFSNAQWTKLASSVAQDVSGPKPKTDAWTLTADGTDAIHAVRDADVTDDSATYKAVSFHVKAGSLGYCSIGHRDFDDTNAADRSSGFDLSDGSTTYTGTTHSGIIPAESLGNGWFRLGFYHALTGVANDNVIISTNIDGTAAGAQAATSGTILIYGGYAWVTNTVPTAFEPYPYPPTGHAGVGLSFGKMGAMGAQ